MTPLRLLIASAAIAAVGAVSAQPSPGSGPGPAASAASSAPGHMGREAMRGRGGMMNMRDTPGWSMMTPAERRAHHDKMRSMKSHDECRQHMEEHHRQMVERAKQRGTRMPGQPRSDACAGLPR